MKGKERKDIAQIKQEMKEASEVLEQICREYMRLHNINEKNREIRDNLRRNFEKNSGLQNQYEIIGNLSKTANGNLSGSAKLDFETYIQRQYFRQIIRAANKRLIRMTSGEFILQCRDVESWEARDRPDWNWMCIIWQQIRSEMSNLIRRRIFYGSAVYGIGTF